MIRRVLSAAVAAVFVLPLLAVNTTPPVADPVAAELLAKHQAYVGWHVGDGVVNSLRMTGTQKRNGKPAGMFEFLRLGAAHRTTTTSEHGVREADGFTGAVAWTSNQNGFTVRAIGEVVRSLYDIDALFGEFTANGSFTGMAGKHKNVDGVDTTVMRLTSQIGFPVDAYVDPASGAYKRVVIDPDGKYQTTYDHLQYAEAGGRRFLSGWTFPEAKLAYTATKVEPNANLDVALLQPPEQTAQWTFGEGTAPVAVHGAKSQRIFVDASINGVKGRFILDTGADGTYVIDSFLRKAGATRFGTQDVGSLYGTSTGNLFRVDSIAVGSSTLHNVIVNSGIDEDDFVSEGAVGLIGFDLLAGAIVDLDLDHRVITLMDPAKVQPQESNGVTLNVDLSDGHIRVPMKLNDKHDVIATLDTGSPNLILLSTDLASSEYISFAYECGQVKSLSVGPIVLQKPYACLTEAFPKNEILVGMDFLKHFNFVFDYPRGTVVLRKRTTEDK